MQILLRRSEAAQLLEPPSPPEASIAKGIIKYDSTLGKVRARGGAVDHREWIVYKGEQALPLFVKAW